MAAIRPLEFLRALPYPELSLVVDTLLELEGIFMLADETLIAIYNFLNHAIAVSIVGAVVLLVVVAIGWRTTRRYRLLKLLAIPVVIIAIVPLMKMGLWRAFIAPSISAKMVAEHQRKLELAYAGPTVAPQLMTVVGDKAPNLTFKDDSGETIGLKQFQGSVVLLNFFGIDCIPCIKEMPELQKIYEEYS